MTPDELAGIETRAEAARIDVSALIAESQRLPAEPANPVSYLPMDCPTCGRRRLLAEMVLAVEPFVRSVECEKCGDRWPKDDDEDQP